MIEQIREYQETIRKQKDILSRLVSLLTTMQEEKDPRKVSELFVHDMLEITKAEGAALFVQGERKGSLWFDAVSGIDAAVMEKLTGEFIRLPVREKEITLISPTDLPREVTNLEQIPLKRGNGNQIGLLLLKGEVEDERKQSIPLFCNPFESFLDNLVLGQKLEIMAKTDGLTGLYNRNYFERVFAEETEKFKKYKVPFTYITGDANGLKPVNDNYGHQAGDDLISAVAGLFKDESRDTDIVFRLGGDEFGIVLPETPQAGGEALIERINRASNRRFVTVSDGTKIKVRVSMGAAGTDRTPVDELLKTADEVMYRVKEEFYKTNKRYR